MTIFTDTGRAGVIVPTGVLFGSGKAERRIRELLLTTCDLKAVITLPSGVFKPYSGVGTAILIFQKGTSTESIWFYELASDGFSLDDKRTAIEQNDIPDLLLRWPERLDGPRSFTVSIDRVRDNSWQLLPSRYRPLVVEAVEHDSPLELLEDILRLEERIISEASAIARRLRGNKQ